MKERDELKNELFCLQDFRRNKNCAKFAGLKNKIVFLSQSLEFLKIHKVGNSFGVKIKSRVCLEDPL